MAPREPQITRPPLDSPRSINPVVCHTASVWNRYELVWAKTTHPARSRSAALLLRSAAIRRSSQRCEVTAVGVCSSGDRRVFTLLIRNCWQCEERKIICLQSWIYSAEPTKDQVISPPLSSTEAEEFSSTSAFVFNL